MSFWGIQTDVIGSALGILGVALSVYFYFRQRNDPREAEKRRLEEYLRGPVAQQVTSLLSKSLYAHLPGTTAAAFSKAWVQHIVEDLPDQARFDERMLCRQARLLVEQVFIDCVEPPTGQPLEPATWPGQDQREHFGSMHNTYRRAKGRLSDPVPHVVATSFVLQRLADVTTPPVSNYFEALSELVEGPTSPLGRSDRFISQVRIQSGFVAPLHLLRGLLTRMSSDWPHMLAQYRRSITVFPLKAEHGERQPELVLEHVQAFQFYCWLLWGPSVQLCKCEAWHGTIQVLQYGYGDENNSLHLVFDDPKIINESWKEIQSAMQESGRPHPLAVQTVLTATPMWGPSLDAKLPWIIDPLEQETSQQSMGLLLRCDAPIDAHDPLVPRLPYYSAYVWIMFEICDPQRRLGPRRKAPWQYCFPLFEHGNIADGTTFLFAKRALVRKALAMIESIEEPFTRGGSSEPDVYLRYVCAIDDPGSSCHDLAFARDVLNEADTLATLLREAVDEPRRARLFGQTTESSIEMMLDTSCHLPYVVEEFYQSLSARG